MSDRDVFYSILGREIDNLMCVNPTLSFLSGPVKNWIFRYIDPYIALFMGEDDALQVDVAAAYVKEEMAAKIDKFKKQFKEEANE